jgi:hypothetical protein
VLLTCFFFKGNGANYLHQHLEVLDIEEVQQRVVVMEQLETVRYWCDVRTGRRRKEVTEAAALRELITFKTAKPASSEPFALKAVNTKTRD